MITPINFTAADAQSAFVDSVRASGFAILLQHPVSTRRLQRIYADWSAFFASPERFDYRHDSASAGDNQHGYFPPGQSETAVGAQHADLKEYFHATLDGALPPQLVDDIAAHRQAAFDLAKTLLQWLDTNIPAAVRQQTNVALASVASIRDSLLRVLHYPALTGEEPAAATRAAAHEDINLITLLPVATEPGLQIKLPGGDWFDVPAPDGAMIINTGDMLQELTGGYIPSTTHRVVNPVHNIARLSLPFFVAPDLTTRLSPRYTAGEYLRERIHDNYHAPRTQRKKDT